MQTDSRIAPNGAPNGGAHNGGAHDSDLPLVHHDRARALHPDHQEAGRQEAGAALHRGDDGAGMSRAMLGYAGLDEAIGAAADALARLRHADGHWVFELEADATIPAEYVLLEHFLDRIDAPLQSKIGVYLRATQGVHGGWPLFHDGAFDISASVKAYFALKAVGDATDAPHMRRAREAILAAGGAERTNVFTRAQLALFGQVPWRAVPVMPVEIMLLPQWFPFHLSKVSYWSRTVIVPLLVLMAKRPLARNPRNIQIPELFRTPAERVHDWIRGPYVSNWSRF